MERFQRNAAVAAGNVIQMDIHIAEKAVFAKHFPDTGGDVYIEARAGVFLDTGFFLLHNDLFSAGAPSAPTASIVPGTGHFFNVSARETGKFEK